MRPDALVAARTPCIDDLIVRGSSTMKARTVMPSVTLPCHTSMHRGVDVSRHGVTTNTFQPLARPVPALMDVAAAQGRRTAMFYNWGELRDLASPAGIGFAYSHNDPSVAGTDRIVADAAVQHIAGNDYDFIFLYLGYTDTAGHDHGWMSQPYIEAIEHADSCVALVLAALAGRGIEPNLLLLSDHGGHDRSHGTDRPEDMTIPWVMNGPAIRQGLRLTQEVRIFDACPTVAALMGLDPAKEWEGRVIDEAFTSV